MSNKLLNK